jgi:hypothetical protein
MDGFHEKEKPWHRATLAEILVFIAKNTSARKLLEFGSNWATQTCF